MRGLLLAEKPSVMRAIQSVYQQGKYSFDLDFGAFHGHLMGLKMPEEYNPAWSDWGNTSNLPMFPAKFEYKAIDTKSVNQLAERIRKGHYDFLVNACDAGREGEHIFWSFYETLGLTIPVKRLWASSITTPALQKALQDLKDPTLYDGMRQASKYRAQFDWLVGMNFSRAASSKTGSVTSIGRVQTPTLKLIADRELEIQNFKPEDFFELKATFHINGADVTTVHLIAPEHKETRFKAQSDAKAVEADVKKKAPGRVAQYKSEIRSTDAPTLFSLAELQKSASKQFRFKADKTLEIAQKLYEDGLLTYPRTESRYLPTDMIPEIPNHIQPLRSVPELAKYAAAIGEPAIKTMLTKKYVNDAGITDHHAIIPTDQAPNWSGMTKDEQAIYTLVGKSFLAIFMPPYKSALSTLVVDVGGHLFQAKGRTEIDPGYSVLYPQKANMGTQIPNCKTGDKADLAGTKVSKGTTKPPQRYTVDTILAAMQNAGQDISNSAMRHVLKESSGLGTSATRADILKKLEDRGYIKYEKNTYSALEKGISLIKEVSDRTFCSALLTAEWEDKLMKMEDGKYQGNFEQEMDAYVREETQYLLSNMKTSIGTVVGACPLCGGKVVDKGRGYVCENWKKDDPSGCRVWIPKESNGHKFTDEDLRILLSGGTTELYELKKGRKTWSAMFVLDKEDGLKFAYPGRKTVGKCPFCGGDVIEYDSFYVCENHKKDNPESCQFRTGKQIAGHSISTEELKTLISSGQIGPFNFKSKEKTWSAYLVLDRESGVTFKFPDRKTVGKCPVCGADVVETTGGYVCENRLGKGEDEGKCVFWMPRKVAGNPLQENEVKSLLKREPTSPRVIKGKDGKNWRVSFYIDDAGAFQIQNMNIVGKCPLCGGDVLETSKAFCCSRKKDDACQWAFPKNIKGAEVKKEDMKAMLNGNRTRPLTFMWKSGQTGSARLYLEDGQLRWAFEDKNE